MLRQPIQKKGLVLRPRPPSAIEEMVGGQPRGGSLSVRGERVTTGLQCALSEAGEGTVLARPDARLSGRARGVVLVAGDEAKRQSGSPVLHFSTPSLIFPPMRAWLEQPHGRRHKAPPQPCALTTNSTPRVRPVRSP